MFHIPVSENISRQPQVLNSVKSILFNSYLLFVRRITTTLILLKHCTHSNHKIVSRLHITVGSIFVFPIPGILYNSTTAIMLNLYISVP